jgi:hypothetical protein
MKTNELSGWEWNRRRQGKLDDNQRDNDGRCEVALPGCLGVATEVHHIVSRVIGGGDDKSTLAAICDACHYRLTTELVQQRAAERARMKKLKKRKNHPGRKDRHDRDD